MAPVSSQNTNYDRQSSNNSNSKPVGFSEKLLHRYNEVRDSNIGLLEKTSFGSRTVKIISKYCSPKRLRKLHSYYEIAGKAALCGVFF